MTTELIYCMAIASLMLVINAIILYLVVKYHKVDSAKLDASLTKVSDLINQGIKNVLDSEGKISEAILGNRKEVIDQLETNTDKISSQIVKTLETLNTKVIELKDDGVNIAMNRINELSLSHEEGVNNVMNRINEFSHSHIEDIQEKYNRITQLLEASEENLLSIIRNCDKDVKLNGKNIQDNTISLQDKISKCEIKIQEVIEMINKPLDL